MHFSGAKVKSHLMSYYKRMFNKKPSIMKAFLWRAGCATIEHRWAIFYGYQRDFIYRNVYKVRHNVPLHPFYLFYDSMRSSIGWKTSNGSGIQKCTFCAWLWALKFLNLSVVDTGPSSILPSRQTIKSDYMMMSDLALPENKHLNIGGDQSTISICDTNRKTITFVWVI